MFKRESHLHNGEANIEEFYRQIRERKQEIQKKSQYLRQILSSDNVCLPSDENQETEDN